ncbi:hypothetical protein ACFV1N_11460 [Streptosporangium canum]
MPDPVSPLESRRLPDGAAAIACARRLRVTTGSIALLRGSAEFAGAGTG